MSKRALVVDDYKDIRSGLRVMLENLGFDVEEAKDGREAIETAERSMVQGQRFDLAIVDHMMPHFKGDVVMVKIREMAKKYDVEPPVMVMLTGSKDGDLVARAQAAGLGKLFIKGDTGFNEIRDFVVGKPAIAM